MRILGIDYGGKRTGIAVTDPLQIIATPLETVPTADLLNFLKDYFAKESVVDIVVGYPKSLKNESTDGTKLVENFVETFKTAFPEKNIHLIDERFTSRMAMQAMVSGGMKKKDRRIKGNVDKVSAAIILQDFLNSLA